ILSRLPLLGMETDAPTYEDVLDRLVVSHEWMGERFEQVLRALPEDILLLMGAVSVIVIADDIRPAGYSPLTAGVYIDPQWLWFTLEELGTVSQAPDYRSDFGNSLQFVSSVRYVSGEERAFGGSNLTATEDRTLDEVTPRMAFVLFHELAHANDVFPPSTWDNLDGSETIVGAVDSAQAVSLALQGEYPLTSELMYALAEVDFLGRPATEEELQVTAEMVGVEFDGDQATDHYAYASIEEDMAMLFEEAMMRYHYGFERDVAFSTPISGADGCDAYVVKWGERSRLGNQDIRVRAQFVASAILPSLDLVEFFESLPEPTRLRNGVSWCDSIHLDDTSQLEIRSDWVQPIPWAEVSGPQIR
ncbi:MAG: hypothetical protein KC561_08110, partial [Myxococcales bacterium]|nr:hypothetical protein [Myxococcales bacterium]